jgi:hypothetical protein
MAKREVIWDVRCDPPECILAEKSDYFNGDPDLTLVRRPDGLYDFVVYRGTDQLAVHALTAHAVREAAHRILALVTDDSNEYFV